MKRVVVTGLGLVSPLGHDVESSWRALLRGDVGVENLDVPWVRGDGVPCQGARVEGGFPSPSGTSLDGVSRAGRLGIAAARMALADAFGRAEGVGEIDVFVGVGVGDLTSVETAVASHVFLRDEPLPLGFEGVLMSNAVSSELRRAFGGTGASICFGTACASSAHAIGQAALHVRAGRTPWILAGGAEASLCASTFVGFSRMRALSSRYGDTPRAASRPFDVGRDGFVMGEGAAFLVLEDYDYALRRGARCYGELRGYGVSGDAGHITSPDARGDGAFRCMRGALAEAGLAAEDVGMVNAHATSTPAGDVAEAQALARLFGSALPRTLVTSTKGATGHLLGAAGAMEAAFTLLSLRDGLVPPTANFSRAGEDVPLVPVFGEPKARALRAALSNSFGFGGSNCSLAFTLA